MQRSYMQLTASGNCYCLLLGIVKNIIAIVYSKRSRLTSPSA